MLLLNQYISKGLIIEQIFGIYVCFFYNECVTINTSDSYLFDSFANR